MPESLGAQQAQSSGSNVASEGGDLDFQGLFQQTQEDLKATKSQNERLSSQFNEVKGKFEESSKTIDRLRAALTGEEGESSKDPVQEEISSLEAQMDEYLNAAIEAERQGRPIPLTVNSALSNLKFQIKYLKEQGEKDKTIKALEEQIKKLSNPAQTIDAMAYSNIDNQVISALDTIYGDDPSTRSVKAMQFEAVTQLLADEIKSLKQEEPEIWDKVRRDKAAQVKLVNHFVKQTIPPRARQLMEEDTIRRTPLSYTETLNAFREAKELPDNDPQKKRIVAELRQNLLSFVIQKNAGKTSRARANDIFSGD